MIEIRYGDLFLNVDYQKVPNTVRAIAHGTNCCGHMRSGFAKPLREKYPEAYQVYRSKHLSSGLNLGDITFIQHGDFYIFNCNTQQFYRNFEHPDGTREPMDKIFVDYDAVENAFIKVNTMLVDRFGEDLFSDDVIEHVELHIPAIGAGKANGNWGLVRERIEKVIDPRIKIILWLQE